MPAIRGVGFIGRTPERERLDAMLGQARAGQSAVLVIRGEPGIGKTALLRYAAGQASGTRAIEVEGIQAEMELSFAGIHRLCAPMLGGLEVLAEPQQNALRVVFGAASGDAPDRFLVAVAVLNLLSSTAEKRPLLCLVGDAQWLDAASLQPLGFVARRAGPGDDGADVMLEICHAIVALPPTAEPPHALDLLLDGLALLTTAGRSAATPILQRAAKAVAGMSANDAVACGPRLAAASSAVWDADGSSAILERQAKLVRDAGALAELPIHRSALATEKAWNGDLASAKLLVAESDRVAAMTGSRIETFAVLRLLTLQGNATEAFAMIETTIREAEAAGQADGEGAKMARWAAAVLNNGLARYDEAASAARQVIANALGPWTTIWVLPELVEAAARSGNSELAHDALARLAESTQPVANDFALGIEARCRALLTDGPAAEKLYREAIDRLRRTPRRPELARAYLVYGEWLRRADRLREARERLRTAEQMFTEIGMEAFAERARGELGAAGVKPRPRHLEVREELTAQEEQIARLARDGFTNTQIGAQLFLSPRTVEYHLHKVFGKLGIDSRSGLRGALPGQEPEALRT